MLAASGGGTLFVALLLPRVLDRITDRTVMLTGAAALVIGVIAAVVLATGGILTWSGTAAIWVMIGGGMALIVTPTGRVLRRSVEPHALPEVFAAQFSLSHLAWLITYPVAGWVGTTSGYATAWSVLAILALAGAVAAMALWPAQETPETVEPQSPAGATARDIAIREATESAEGTLAAGQCTCVRTV